LVLNLARKESTVSDTSIQGSQHIPARGRRLPAGAAFALQVSIVVFFLAGSSAPTPLYALYQAKWGFSPITTTVIFGVYALAVLAALLTVGSLSDHVGRRPVLLAAIAGQAATMLVFATAGNVTTLLVARIIQGLATGAAVGAVGAGLMDLSRSKGTIANAVAPVTGTATGAIGAGLLVQYLPDPAHLVYLILFVIFIGQGIGVALMPETSTPRPGALASLRPQLGVPPAARKPLLAVIPALVAVWALAGFYGSVGPALVGLLSGSGSGSAVLSGLALFALAASGAVTVMVLRAVRPATVLLIGGVALIAGVGITLLAVSWSSTVVFFVGTVVAGVGFGAGFQGAIKTVLPLAAPHQRAGLLSTMYVVSYLALGLPAVIGGVLVVHDGGVLSTAREYGLAVMALALLALLGLARRPRARRPSAAIASCPGRGPGQLAWETGSARLLITARGSDDGHSR
jgi:MFS family permease